MTDYDSIWRSSAVAELYTPEVFENKKTPPLIGFKRIFCIFAENYTTNFRNNEKIRDVINMKQFKLLSMLLAILMVPMMVSCGGDDEKDDNPSGDDLIIKASGTWMCTQSVDTQGSNTFQGLMVGKEITINPNGTYTSTAPTFGYSGTYTVSGNKITAHSDAGGKFLINVSISGDRMTWEGTASNGVSFRYIFERESNVVPSEKAFTKEIIAGDFQWKVNNVSIKRGSSSIITEGKTIRFYENGSCEGFHSMENAWRINNGRIETYYKQTEEPIYVYTLLSSNSDELLVRIDGTLDNNLQAEVLLTKDIIPNSTTTEDNVFDTKAGIKAIYASCYAACAEFEEWQLKLEGIRLNSNTVHRISSGSTEVYNTWMYAYQTINRINLVLEKEDAVMEKMGNQDGKALIAELRALRAFVNYNIGMLWGRVPLLTQPITIDGTQTPQSSQAEVFQFAYDEINSVLDDLRPSFEQENGQIRFNKDAGLMLKAELAMSLGNKQLAAATLNQIEKSRYNNTRSASSSFDRSFIWALYTQQNTYCPVYTVMHTNLYLYENSGSKDGLDLPTIDLNKDGMPDEDVESFWHVSEYTDYGYWAALKRMGKAQEVTGCYDYELLMPIPSQDLSFYPNFTQNPGY